MSKKTESQIKDAIITAKNLSENRENNIQGMRSFANLSQTGKSRSAAEQLFTSFLTRNNFDFDKVDKILLQNKAERNAVLEKLEAEAIKESIKTNNKISKIIELQRKNIQNLTEAVSAPYPFYIVLDKPFLIWPTNGLYFEDSHYESWNSWGKVKLDSSKSSVYAGISEKLTFYFMWQNPVDTWAVINADGYLIHNGFCSVQSDSGTFAGDRRSSVTIYSNLNPMEWWNQPPTQPMTQSDQSVQIFNISCESGSMFDFDGGFNGDYVFRGSDSQYKLMIVPPKGVVVFEVVSVISYSNGVDGGKAHVDFSSNDFKIICPFMLLSVLT
ncbi:MAG: hypothetical protein WAM24_19290 [Ignavibacteriaceae bacterium]